MELCIWDTLGDCQPKTLDPIIGSSSLRTQRIECLWKSVNAVKSSLDILLSLSPLTWVGLSILEVSQISKSFKALLYLALHDDPAWDKQAARDVCDPITVLDQVIRISDEASVAVGETCRDDIFKMLGNHTRGLREWARFSLGETVDISSTNDGESVERPADDSWNLPPFFSTFAMPASAFGTGEWMERIFDEPYLKGLGGIHMTNVVTQIICTIKLTPPPQFPSPSHPLWRKLSNSRNRQQWHAQSPARVR